METLFSNSEIKLAEAFAQDVKNKKYILQPTELKSNKSQHMYNSFIDLTIGSKPKIFYQNDFKKLDKEDIYYILVRIIHVIFGDSDEIDNEIDEFLKIICLSHDKEILSGVKLTFKNTETGLYQSIVEVPSFDNTSSIVSLIHEFVHLHMFNKNIDLNKKFYYTEIFSIYAEKVATFVIEKFEKCQSDMTKKIENTRLEGIAWHYTKRIKEMAELQKIYNAIKKGIMPTTVSKEELEKQFPWLKSSKMKNIYNSYRENLAYSYGFGYLYGEALFNNYLNDEKTTTDVKKVLNGEENIENLLKQYNIGINQQTIATAKQKVKKVTNE